MTGIVNPQVAEQRQEEHVHTCTLFLCCLKKTGNVLPICMGFGAENPVVHSCSCSVADGLRKAQAGSAHDDHSDGDDLRSQL